MCDRDEPVAAPDVDPVFLAVWDTLEACGSWLALDLLFTGKMGQKAERDADSEIAEKLAEAKVRLAKALDYERIHGHGSLLVHDHPFNIRMTRHLGKPDTIPVRTAA